MIKYQDLINGPTLFSDRFEFKLIQGNITSGSLATPGAKTIGIRPCPPGVAGSNTDYYIRISGGTGTAESVLVTGGTATSGGDAGTLQFTTVNAHTGNWHIESATAGISEAIWTLPPATPGPSGTPRGPGGKVIIPSGRVTVYSPVRRRPNMAIWVEGAGRDATSVLVSTDFPVSARGVFDWSPADSTAAPLFSCGGITNMSIQFEQPDSTNVASYTHWPPAFYSSGVINPTVSSVNIYAAWDGIKLDNALGVISLGGTYSDIIGTWFNRMFDLDGSYDTVRIDKFQGYPLGLTTNQYNAFTDAAATMVTFYVGRVDDLKISNTATFAAFSDFHTGYGGGMASGSMINCWADRGGYVQSDGLLRYTGGSIGGALTGRRSLSITGGQLYVSGTLISNSVGLAAVFGYFVNGAAFNPVAYPPMLSITGSQINTLGGDIESPYLGTTDTPWTGIAYFLLCNNLFIRYPDINYVKETVHIIQGTGDSRLTATGNTFSPIGSGSVNSITAGTDNYHVITGNSGGGGAYFIGLVNPAKVVFSGNANFLSNMDLTQDRTRIHSKLSPDTFVPRQTENYIASETGVNNAIAGALTDASLVALPLAAGVKVTILLAHTLQAGANTFNFNAGGAVNIKSSRNPANNIATAYAVGGILTITYDGTQWLDVSQ